MVQLPSLSDMITHQVQSTHWMHATGKTRIHLLNNDHFWNMFWHDVGRGIAQGRWESAMADLGGAAKWVGKNKVLNRNTQFSAPTKF